MNIFKTRKTSIALYSDTIKTISELISINVLLNFTFKLKNYSINKRYVNIYVLHFRFELCVIETTGFVIITCYCCYYLLLLVYYL